MNLEHPLLRVAGVRHGFGTRDATPPAGLCRPRQVHGAAVSWASQCAAGVEADAVLARPGDAPVAVVTADCVPILTASADGRAVAAIHAGWRGLAAGVIEAGIDALRHETRADLRAVIGPRIGACCYEVDAPVLDALRHRDPDLADATRESRPHHWWLDLGLLARHALERCGMTHDAVGILDGVCTACDPERFHSYRRDGPRSGRLVHWIAPPPA